MQVCNFHVSFNSCEYAVSTFRSLNSSIYEENNNNKKEQQQQTLNAITEQDYDFQNKTENENYRSDNISV